MIKLAFFLIVSLVVVMTNADAQTMPQEGQKAPDFSMQDQDGNTHSLATHKGKYVVLYFYPKDDTPGCTKEACGFRDDIGDIEAKGAVVLGVSTDDVESHKLFAEKFHLNFPLLADTDKSVSTHYGVLGESGYAKRVTFLIDGTGTIVKVYPAVSPVGHSQELLADIETAKNK